jgi:hypothetical protein
MGAIFAVSLQVKWVVFLLVVAALSGFILVTAFHDTYNNRK